MPFPELKNILKSVLVSPSSSIHRKISALKQTNNKQTSDFKYFAILEIAHLS